MLTHTSSFSLAVSTAILRDISDVFSCQLTYEVDYIKSLSWPDCIIHFATLGKAIDNSLITGSQLVVDPLFPLSSSSTGDIDSCLPRFLYLLFSEVWTDSGFPLYRFLPPETIVDVAGTPVASSSEAIKHSCAAVFLLRQFFSAFSKASDIPVIANEELEWSSFVSRITERPNICLDPNIDQKVAARLPTDYPVKEIVLVARRLLQDVLYPDNQLHPSLAQWVSNPWGKHGPGAVAGGEKGREKWFFLDNPRFHRGLLTGSYSEKLPNTRDGFFPVRPARACMVPKDFRKHRIICAEPKELQYAQQGLCATIMAIVQENLSTRRHIDFSSQEKSFDMSHFYGFSTIDLEDASDRLSLRLFELLFPKEFVDLVIPYRSRSVSLPDGQRHYTQSAFTMGNALCFPIETLAFWAISAAVLLGDDRLGRCYDRLSVSKLPLRVFGDDIILPVWAVNRVCGILTLCGLRPNASKTCNGSSSVREACGSWWYLRQDCRIVKFHYAERLDIVSWTSFFDVIGQLTESGLIHTANAIETCLHAVYPIPRFLLSKRGVAVNDIHGYIRFNKDLCRLEYRRPLSDQADTRALPGAIGLTAYWTKQATRVLYPNSQRVKYRWVSLS